MANVTKVKVCNKCGVEGPHYTLKGDKTHSWCVKCVNHYNRKQFQKHKPAWREQRKHYHIQQKYGLSKVDYYTLSHQQLGCCKLCGLHTETLVVDHNHTTGQVRGLLCSSCNLALGFYEQSIRGNVIKVEEYLNG